MNSSLDTFRHESYTWLEQNCPPSMRTPMRKEDQVWAGKKQNFYSDDAKIWFQRMRDKGWIMPTFPSCYGGAGLDPLEHGVLMEELHRIGARAPCLNLAQWMMGPTILKYGSEEQKERFLPPIARGEVMWCQGYSEPSSGSDLASLRTRALDEGSHFLVNGQKVWTSYGDESDYMFCLVRSNSNPSVKKQAGISVLLIDMNQSGVEARPIDLISGASNFCDVFIDNVKVPKNNLLGELDGGWSIAKYMMQHEREHMGSMDFGGAMEPTISELAEEYLEWDDGRVRDKCVRSRVAKNEMIKNAIDLTVARTRDEQNAVLHSPVAMIMKYVSSKYTSEKYELMLEILGYHALGADVQSFSEMERLVTYEWLYGKAKTIAGGTNEIQLNVISQALLGLPKSGNSR